MKYTRHTVSSDSENRIATTIAHEYGHILADQYFGQINHSRLCPNYASTFKSREIVEMAYTNRIPDDVINDKKNCPFFLDIEKMCDKQFIKKGKPIPDIFQDKIAKLAEARNRK